jgi:hypothetical protein
MKQKNRQVGARKAGDHLTIARKHFTKCIEIIDDYNLRTEDITNSDCICDMAQLEQLLYEIEMEHP